MRYSKETKSQAVELYLSGLSCQQVADKLNIKNHVSVHQWIKKSKYNTRKPLIHTKETKNKVIRLYTSGLEMKQVANELNISDGFVKKVLIESHVEIRLAQYSQTLKNKAIELYKTNPNKSEIARQLGVNSDTIRYWLQQHNIPIREFIGGRPRIYSVNDNFLDNIDTEEKAYFLGFFSGDGYVNLADKSFAFILSAKDIRHLYNLRSILSSNNPIHTHIDKGFLMCSISIHSALLVQRLVELGFDNDKSFTAKPIESLDDTLASHYWRGNMDADGSIYFLNKHQCYGFSLCGTYDICNGFSNYLGYNGKYVNKQGQKNLWSFVRAGNIRAYDNLHRLYHNANISLQRKFNLYKDLEECLPPKFPGF
ncbi:MAG: MerR family transcriptional regulator [Candidatus Komeilibacteria bacterium]